MYFTLKEAYESGRPFRYFMSTDWIVPFSREAQALKQNEEGYPSWDKVEGWIIGAVETRSTHGLFCPYCMHEDRDVEFDITRECGETECGKCGKEFIWASHVTVTWIGKPMEGNEHAGS
jgi:hypothetical protein